MRILEINIQNFRKLLQCHIEFSEKTTLFVGANNSGKTSAMDALGKFLADRNFTFNDITISERSAINVIGERWIQKDCEEPTTITEWESLMPKMDIWLNVASNEMHYVACIIPTLKWRGGKLGVRLAFFPKDIVKLFTDYRDAYFAAREVEKAKENVEIRLYPINLSEFLEKNLNTYFSIKTYILDEAKEEQGNPQETPFEMECFIDNPLKKIIKVDMIDAQRGFTDPDNTDGTIRSKQQLSEQMRDYYEKHLDPEKLPSSEDLDILHAAEEARKAFDKNLVIKFRPAIQELEGLGYPGMADPKLTITTKMSMSETLKHDAAVQYTLSKNDTTLKLPEKYNGLGYQNLISMVFDLMRFRDDSEVIKMSTEFIATEPTMQDILTSKYPILLIDESQDTKKELIDALLIVCEKYGEKFIVGMFGDTMQKIYNDGKDNLAKCIPDNWVKPVKIMNHRSAKRIVTLANSIRSSVDDQKQQARSDAEEGTVRLFITSKSNNKEYVEKRVAEMMVQDTGDIGWNDEEDYKSLILEHHMAASRFGFSELYMPLSNSKKFDTSLREGSIPELSILSKLVFSLLVAYQSGNDFEVAKIIRKNSPLLNKEVFITGLNNQVELLRKAEEAVELLMKLWNDGKVPTCLEVLKSIRDTGLFKVGNRVDEVLADYSQDENEKITALRTALSAPFYELERYALYVSDNTRFATHQGVKGLEFPRVMVILDDAQARGFLFSYEKLFGVKAQSDTDEKNAHDGKDTSITRTARLFYVACTRAKKSLAIVAYTENEEMVRDAALANGWFLENEIYIV